MESFWIELFLRGLFLCLLSAMALLLLRRAAAAYRHLMCVLSLLVLPLLPWAPQRMPTLRLLPPRRAATSQRAPLSSREASRLSDLIGKTETPPESVIGAKPSILLPAGSGAEHGSAIHPPTPHRELAGKASEVFFAIWGVGAATLLLRLIGALFRLRGLEARSREAMLGSVPIRISEQVQTPLTWGVRRSVILLPAALLSGDRAVCESALRHEQAHIARWDWIWNILAEIICAFSWFQPGAWWLRSRMRLESERACDDRVLLSGVAGPDYAAHLVQILRSVGSNEVAPAMAQSRRGMEERMRHILDGAKPRHAPTKWLVVSAAFALALLSLAAVRVSARPTEAKRPTDQEAATLNPNLSSSRQSKPADTVEKPGATDKADGLQVNVNPALRLEDVAWGKAVDGLEPGFLLTTPGLLKNRRVAFNSRVDYQVLVRNVTNRERFVEVRCGESNPWVSAPYLIPSDDLREALRSRILPERFHAMGVTELSTWVTAYEVRIAPGEAIVVPGERGLTIGDADKQSFPRIETVKAGINWIVQPIRIRPLTADEQAQAERTMSTPYSEKRDMTTVDRDGKTGRRSVALIGAGSEGKQLFARIKLEVGARDAGAFRKDVSGRTPPSGGDAPSKSPTAPASLHLGDASVSLVSALQEPDNIAWGPGREVQAGLRARLWAAPQHAARFIFDVYLRNRTSHTLSVHCPSYVGLTAPTDSDYETEVQSDLIYCSPHLQDSNGRPVDVAFRLGTDDSQFTLGPGQVVNVSHWMLRTMDLRAKGTQRGSYTLVAFVEPGKHRMSCDLSVSWEGKGGDPRTRMLRTGAAAFDVIGADVASE